MHDLRASCVHLEDLVHKGPRMLDQVPKYPKFLFNFFLLDVNDFFLQKKGKEKQV